MRKRDVFKAAAAAHVPSSFDITAEELNQLYDVVKNEGPDGLYLAITTAFKYGFVSGKSYADMELLESFNEAAGE